MTFQFGWPCRRPRIGFEYEKLMRGGIVRLIFWPERFGVYLSWWRS
jgi:hypothetical protein